MPESLRRVQGDFLDQRIASGKRDAAELRSRIDGQDQDGITFRAASFFELEYQILLISFTEGIQCEQVDAQDGGEIRRDGGRDSEGP